MKPMSLLIGAIALHVVSILAGFEAVWWGDGAGAMCALLGAVWMGLSLCFYRQAEAAQDRKE